MTRRVSAAEERAIKARKKVEEEVRINHIAKDHAKHSVEELYRLRDSTIGKDRIGREKRAGLTLAIVNAMKPRR